MSKSIAFQPHLALPDVDILRGHTVRHSYPRHFHDALGIAVIHDGVELCWSRGAERVFRGGEVALFNAGEVHDGRPADGQGWTYDMIYLPHVTVCHLLGQEQGWFDLVSTRSPEVLLLARRAVQAATGADSAAAEESTIALLSRLVHRQRSDEADPSVAQRLREFIDSHAAQVLTVQKMSEFTGLSPEHTIRSFRARFGITPHAYQQARRAENARSMLRGRRPLADIALALGFYDQSHFTRWFRSTQGVPPSAYRDALKGASILSKTLPPPPL